MEIENKMKSKQIEILGREVTEKVMSLSAFIYGMRGVINYDNIINFS